MGAPSGKHLRIHIADTGEMKIIPLKSASSAYFLNAPNEKFSAIHLEIPQFSSRTLCFFTAISMTISDGKQTWLALCYIIRHIVMIYLK
jgi:hypothetical protein